ncbi:MAG TPA: hypothetical protein VHD60_02765 [Candidatus Saccharimonadales bacterium]|nr:hypothetical protein [Candidatus Saccharimonadales bacterium]
MTEPSTRNLSSINPSGFTVPGVESYTLASNGTVKSPEEIRSELEAATAQMFRLVGSDDPRYQFFGTARLRQELFDLSAGLVNYAHDNEAKAIVLMDRSARLAHIGIREIWRTLHEPEGLPMPDIFFVNPRGFRPYTTDALEEILKVSRTHNKYGDIADSPSRRRAPEIIKEDFVRSFPRLLQHADEVVILFDTCVHSGNQAQYVIETLEEAGLTQLHFVIGSVSLMEQPRCAEPDLILNETEPAAYCWPFGMDRATQKTYASTLSTRATNIEEPGQSKALRREIRHIIRERLAANGHTVPLPRQP